MNFYILYSCSRLCRRLVHNLLFMFHSPLSLIKEVFIWRWADLVSWAGSLCRDLVNIKKFTYFLKMCFMRWAGPVNRARNQHLRISLPANFYVIWRTFNPQISLHAEVIFPLLQISHFKDSTFYRFPVLQIPSLQIFHFTDSTLLHCYIHFVIYLLHH